MIPSSSDDLLSQREYLRKPSWTDVLKATQQGAGGAHSWGDAPWVAEGRQADRTGQVGALGKWDDTPNGGVSLLGAVGGAAGASGSLAAAVAHRY